MFVHRHVVADHTAVGRKSTDEVTNLGCIGEWRLHRLLLVSNRLIALNNHGVISILMNILDARLLR